ncbi:LOW QUALITY PROTEIN: transcriptional activator hacA [Colletes gigas]|uniref:LOW QUALITY PROTEIN: transcriptional activator hacA n=1 Tax=Colletes gigas TaxID=935657 RepID=UPI001C9AA121|nr:LOW QUALITY PROTEIN: transcriptional activator hacA [Colletes gigas]
MNVLKSVVIALPKGLSKTPSLVSDNQLSKSLTKFNFTTSILTDKSNMDTKRMTKHEEVQDEGMLFKTDVCVRGKKRRLDHLTWEEKLQRKKLKNRVAAQTSRDRKKAKLDELEDTVRTLREQNDLLMQECTVLRSQNELLVTETKRLRKDKDTKSAEVSICSMCQSRVGCAVSPLGSTVSPAYPLQQGGTTQLAPSLTLTPGAAISENIDQLPPLEELFGDLQGDDYIERLEELAESLLREVTAEVEANPCRTNEQVSVKKNTIEKRDHTKGVVGQASKNVEADRTSRSMSSYDELWHPVTSTVATPCTVNTSAPPVSIKSEVEVKQEVDTHDLDTVYGTYDETTNSITIIYPGDESNVGIQECVQEVSTDGGCLTEDSSYVTSNYYYSHKLSPSYTCTDSMSPSSIYSADTDNGFTPTKLDSNASDCGYESHNSPTPDIRNEKTTVALSDLWHESFSELFPTLA